MSDNQNDRIQIGAKVNRNIYKRFKAKAALKEKPIGQLIDEALELYLNTDRQWPDDNENEERE
jgi:hypothetical protein